MKKLVAVTEVEDDGFEGLIGENVTLFCLNYIYTGKLVGVNDRFVLLENAKVVYETGPFGDKSWKDAQPLPQQWRVMLSAVESYGILK